jgi:hypothetical protein
MPGYLRQSTASQSRAIGPFIDDTDFKTPKTGLTIANTDIKLVVNGGASANKNSGGGTHRVNGVYGVTFDATDTATVGEMQVSVVVSSALIVFDKFVVVEEAVYDRDYAASALGYVDGATVNATKWNSLSTVALPLVPTTAGRTLDVSTTGEAGVDWSNVGSPTTTVGLTGTTISTSQVVASVTAGVTLAASGVQAIWDALTSALTTAGSIGKLIVDNLNAAITSRMATYTQPTGFLAATFPGTVASPTNITAASGVALTAAYDAAKTAAQAGDAMALTSGERTTVSTSVWASATRTLTSFGTLAADVWTAVTRVLTAGTNIVLAKGTGVTGFNDLSAAQVNAEADTALADAGVTSVRQAKLDNLPEGIKKNTALSNFEFFMADASDGRTGKTGLSITALRSIDGGAFASCANAATEVSGGFYKINLDAADLNGTVITFLFSGAGADDTGLTVKTSV